MKKVVSILLTASMIACSAALPFTAVAAETTGTVEQTSEGEKNTTADDSTIKDIAVFEEGEMMTLDDVVELSKKGNDLKLNDFAKFKGVVAGSGIFILEYDLGKGYTLMVGSMTLEKVDYARLRYSGSENYIDIRTDDVEAFIAEMNANNDSTSLTGTKDMTLNDVMRLAELGDELDWADFKDYKGRDVGSGLYIWEYKLEGGFVLDVGGDMQKKPIYILLSHDNDKGIDIRTNDVKEYIASMTVPVVNENETVTYKIITTPDKTVYKLGESINLKGIQVEVQKGDEKPVIYAYPDVAFDYQSNIPKAPTVTLSGDYKRDKVGTVAIKVVGSDDVLFNVEFVEDSTVKTQEYSFEDILDMSTDELNKIFESKGMTWDKGFKVFSSENNLKGYSVCISPKPYMQSVKGDELITEVKDANEIYKLFTDDDVIWNINKIYSSLGISPEFFGINAIVSVTHATGNEETGSVYRNYCRCFLTPITTDKETYNTLLAAALNYVQLNPDFVGIFFEAPGAGSGMNIPSTVNENVKGDANCDGELSMADAVLIMQSIANPAKFGIKGTNENHLTEHGSKNADIAGNNDGITNADALTIQRKLLGLDSDSVEQLGLKDSKIKSVNVTSLPGGYDYTFTDTKAQKFIDFLSDLELTADFSEDPGQLGGMTWVIKLEYQNNETMTLYDIGGFIRTGNESWLKYEYDYDNPLNTLIWELSNDVTPSEPTTIGFSSYEEYTKYIEENDLANKIVTYDQLTQYGEFVQFSINSHWMYDNTFSLFYVFDDGSGKTYDFIINDRPQHSEDLVAYPKLTDAQINKSDMRTADTDEDAYYEFDNKYYIYTNGKLSQIKWFDDKHIYILIGNPMLYDYPKVDNTYMSKLLDISSTTSTDNSVIAGKIFAYEKEGAGGYCTLSFNENGRFLYSPGKLSSYMGGGDWKIDGDTVSLIGMVDKTIYLKITDDTLVYIAESSDEFPYMDIKDGEKFAIYRPEISSDKFQLNSRYSEYGLGNPKVELNLIASELPEFCYVENVRLYDEDDNFIGTMSPAMDADIWGYLIDCNITEECSKTFYTLTKIRCGQKTYLDDVRSEIIVNFKATPAP